LRRKEKKVQQIKLLFKNYSKFSNKRSGLYKIIRKKSKRMIRRLRNLKICLINKEERAWLMREKLNNWKIF
jgi:hypothetical protein